MSIAHGTRVLIKSALQMGMTRNHYLFTEHAGKHLYVCESALNNPGCYVLCPEAELDGENGKFRTFNNKRPFHVVMPECCFILDPVTKKEKSARKNSKIERTVRTFTQTLNATQLANYQRVLSEVMALGVNDIEQLLKLMEL